MAISIRPRRTSEVARHAELDERMESEWLRGSEGLIPDVKPLIRTRSLKELKQLCLHKKQLWLSSIRAGRKTFAHAHYGARRSSAGPSRC
jgi:hypothetical protein